MPAHSRETHVHIELDPALKLRMELFATMHRRTKRDVIAEALVRYLDQQKKAFSRPEAQEAMAAK
jgi:predicted transcriptional regulator